MTFINKQTISNEQRDSLIRAEDANSAGNIQIAESEYRKLVATQIRLPQVYSQLALICAKTNRIDEAKQHWTFALELSPTFTDALLGLGA